MRKGTLVAALMRCKRHKRASNLVLEQHRYALHSQGRAAYWSGQLSVNLSQDSCHTRTAPTSAYVLFYPKRLTRGMWKNAGIPSCYGIATDGRET